MLYDGHCRFCTQSAKKLARRFGPERVRAVSFQDDGVLASYPPITYEAAMKRLYVVAPNGKVYAGAGAVARLVRSLHYVGWIGFLYYTPVLKQLADVLY